MLDISELPTEPQSEDWGFVFAGRNTVTSLRGQPGLPWRLSEVAALGRKLLRCDTRRSLGGAGRMGILCAGRQHQPDAADIRQFIRLAGQGRRLAISRARAGLSVTLLAGYASALRPLRQPDPRHRGW